MSSVVLSGDTSGTVTVAVPAVAGTNTVTIAAQTGTLNAAGPTFSAYQSSAQSIPDGTFTKVNFQTEEWDTANCFDNATNYRFTPTVAGYYQVSGGASLSQLASGSIAVVIYKNGTAWKQGSSGFGSASFYPKSNVSAIVYLNGSTDYVEIYVAQNYGSSYNLITGSALTYFQAALVRGA